MKKKAKDLKEGDKISIGGRKCTVVSVETSDIGKQGKKKCRIEAKAENEDKVIIIRPEDYPIESA